MYIVFHLKANPATCDVIGLFYNGIHGIDACSDNSNNIMPIFLSFRWRAWEQGHTTSNHSCTYEYAHFVDLMWASYKYIFFMVNIEISDPMNE